MAGEESTPWATPTDIRERWLAGPLPQEDAQLEVLIADATDVVLAEFPTIPDRLAAGDLTEDRLLRVVVRMSHRVLRNPEGYRQVTQGTGPFTGSATFGGDNPGELYLTDADRRDLGGRTAGRSRRAFTIRPGGIR